MQESKTALLAAQKSPSLGVGGEMGGLGGDDFGSLQGTSSGYCWEGDGGWGGPYGGGGSNDRSDVRSGGRGTYRKVSSRNTETVDGVRDVAGALDETMTVDVGVAAAGDAVSGSGLGLGAGAAGISIAVLSQSVLSVVLVGYRSGDTNRGDCCVWRRDGQAAQEVGLSVGKCQQAGDDHLHTHHQIYSTFSDILTPTLLLAF
jgi:hypothetical protein